MKREQVIRWVLVLTLVMMSPLVASAQGTLFVEGDQVGVGIATPTAPLHVYSTAGDSQILVEEASGTAAARTMYTLRNNGGVRFGMVNSGSGSIWQFSALANFNIDYNGNPGNELQVKSNGDVVIGGVLTQSSSKALKTDFVDFDPAEVLAGIAELPIQGWTYQSDKAAQRHIGPFAEDVHRVFGLGEPTHLAPSDQVGLALLAIQSLNQQIQEKDRQIDELLARITQIEMLVGGGEVD